MWPDDTLCYRRSNVERQRGRREVRPARSAACGRSMRLATGATRGARAQSGYIRTATLAAGARIDRSDYKGCSDSQYGVPSCRQASMCSPTCRSSASVGGWLEPPKDCIFERLLAGCATRISSTPRWRDVPQLIRSTGGLRHDCDFHQMLDSCTLGSQWRTEKSPRVFRICRSPPCSTEKHRRQAQFRVGVIVRPAHRRATATESAESEEAAATPNERHCQTIELFTIVIAGSSQRRASA